MAHRRAYQASSLPATPGPMTNSCCLLKRKSGEGYFKKGQGVLLRFVSNDKYEPFVRTDASLALLTCHHLIPSKEAVSDWKVVFGEDSFLELDKSMVSHFFTCCGNDGILGEKQHAAKDRACPFYLDFSLILLNLVNALPPGIKLVKLRNAIDSWKMVEKLYSQDDNLKLEIYRRLIDNSGVTYVIYEAYEDKDLVWEDQRLSWFRILCLNDTQIAEGASGSPGYVMKKNAIIFGMRNEKLIPKPNRRPNIEECSGMHNEPSSSIDHKKECFSTYPVLACVNVSWIIQLLNAWERHASIEFMRAVYQLYGKYNFHAKEESLLKKAERLLSLDVLEEEQEEEHDAHLVSIKPASSIIENNTLSS